MAWVSQMGVFRERRVFSRSPNPPTPLIRGARDVLPRVPNDIQAPLPLVRGARASQPPCFTSSPSNASRALLIPSESTGIEKNENKFASS